jgi:hypothetical protein
MNKIPLEFKKGLRLIILTMRRKDFKDGIKPDGVAKRKISRNEAEFDSIVNEFSKELKKSSIPLRIYSSVNARDIKKSIREFKQRQLEADYYDEENKNEFYFDIKNRWISCFMRPSCRAETKFLIDLDNVESVADAIIYAERLLIDLKVKIIARYLTKNGAHIITEPFNPSLWHSDLGEIKKDGMMLICYKKEGLDKRKV